MAMAKTYEKNARVRTKTGGTVVKLGSSGSPKSMRGYGAKGGYR